MRQEKQFPDTARKEASFLKTMPQGRGSGGAAALLRQMRKRKSVRDTDRQRRRLGAPTNHDDKGGRRHPYDQRSQMIRMLEIFLATKVNVQREGHVMECPGDGPRAWERSYPV